MAAGLFTKWHWLSGTIPSIRSHVADLLEARVGLVLLKGGAIGRTPMRPSGRVVVAIRQMAGHGDAPGAAHRAAPGW